MRPARVCTGRFSHSRMCTDTRLWREGKALVLSALLVLVPATGTASWQQDFEVPVESVIDPLLAFDWPEIERFYDALGEPYAWHRDGTPTPQAEELFAWLSAADREGLSPGEYHVALLRRLGPAVAKDRLLLRELLLTDGYLRLARYLRRGRFDPMQVDPLWRLPRETFDPVSPLVSALQQGDLSGLLESLGPRAAAYARLRQALARYRAIHAAGGWRPLQFDVSLRPGMRRREVTELRRRLAVEEGASVEIPGDAEYYDDRLRQVVREYQGRVGLIQDGIVGKKTLHALNVPVEQRVAQLRAALERWRWLPHHLESEYLLINTAAFEIDLMEGDHSLFHKRTVNGREERQTPSFRSQVTHLVINPEWTVPRSIAVRDLLPKQQDDSGFLSARQFRVYRERGGAWFEVDATSIEWSLYDTDYFPFILKQDAGSGNSLGRFKFYMPNRYDIYLHDTPARGLFERSSRAFSSGCVRVEGAAQLADLLLARAGSWERVQFNRALQREETLTLGLVQPMPVYLAYFTSWVDEAGKIHFRPDLYLRDDRLLSALNGDPERLVVLGALPREHDSF